MPFNSVHLHDFQITDVHPTVPCSVHVIDVQTSNCSESL
jgi:hypothetical protein